MRLCGSRSTCAFTPLFSYTWRLFRCYYFPTLVAWHVVKFLQNPHNVSGFWFEFRSLQMLNLGSDGVARVADAPGRGGDVPMASSASKKFWLAKKVVNLSFWKSAPQLLNELVKRSSTISLNYVMYINHPFQFSVFFIADRVKGLS